MKTLIAVLTALTLSAGVACAASTTPTTGNESQQNTPTAAQPNSATNTQASDQTSTQQSGKLTQQLRDNLAQAGFTDIKIMPEAFLIRAKDKNGNPMMMVINPDSMTEIRAVDTNNANNKPSPSGNNSGPSTKQ